MKTIKELAAITTLLQFILIMSVLMTGCQSTPNKVAAKAVKQVGFKYSAGDCVQFDPTKVTMRVDGTPMKVLEVNGNIYSMVIIHKDVEGPVLFTAVASVFDGHTLKVKCPSYFRR